MSNARPHSHASLMQAERAALQDERPEGRDTACRGSVYASHPPSGGTALPLLGFKPTQRSLQ